MSGLTRFALRACVVVCAFTAVAGANPFPVSIPGTFGSRGLQGQAFNGYVQASVTLTPVVTHVTLTGTLTSSGNSTWASEACIEVVPPLGAPYIIKPFAGVGTFGTLNVPVGSVTVPIDGNGTSGTYQFRFFELFQDSGTGPDATWSNLTVTFHNAVNSDVSGFDNYIPPSDDPAEGSTIYLDPYLVTTYAPHNVTVQFPQPRAVQRVRVRAYGTASRGWTADNSSSPLGVLSLTFTAQKADFTGPITWTTAHLFSDSAPSSSQVDGVFTAPVPVLTGPGADWTYSIDHDPAIPTPAGQTLARVWLSMQTLTPAPPPAFDLGAIGGHPALGPVATMAAVATEAAGTPGGVSWFSFNTAYPCQPAGPYWLDIHTRSRAGAPVDHQIALYDDLGVLITSDDDSGYFHDSMLTFGDAANTRPTVDPLGATYQRDGHNGQLDAGRHYLAVTQFQAAFPHYGYAVSTTGAATNNIGVEFRTNLPPVPPGSSDMGMLVAGGPDLAYTNLLPNGYQWFRFSIAHALTLSTPWYLDIDTIDVGAPYLDTEIACYNSSGFYITSDDDDGRNNSRSQLTFGPGAPARPAIGNSSPGNGRDGSLQVGTYYVVASLFEALFYPDWVVTSDANIQAIFPVHFRTNLIGPACGPADVGSQGGIAGADGRLDNNDFIIYINMFFGADPAADIGVPGGTAGSDGHFDNNDFIVYINRFFAGCV